MSHHVIYVPGLGDNRTFGQNLVINIWRLFGLTPHYVALGWENKESFEAKCGRLLEQIDRLKGQNNYVSLVGASAGASAVINAFVASGHITGVVLICGKINHPETVLPRRYEMNPDFKESIELLQLNLARLTASDKLRILSLYPQKDTYVPYADTVIPGVAGHQTLGWNHVQGIFFGLVLGARTIARFLRSQEPI